LLGAGFAAMLLFVLHLLGDLLEIGSRSCELRRLSVLQQDFQGPQRVLFLRASSALQTLCIGQVQHNVFWSAISGNKKLGHNLGTWPKGEKRSFKFDQPGVVPLLCNAHPEMAGYIIVSPTPYFAETDESGNYKLENVPDGKYNLVAWHEGMKQQTKPLSVPGTNKVDFSLSK